MTVKKIRILALACCALAAAACQKEPSTSGLHNEFLVYTDHDTAADFSSFGSYFLPDSILVIGSNNRSEYWKDADALSIVGRVAENLDAAGYVRSSEIETANLGIQLSYVRQTVYYAGYDRPYWWWYYPYYWAPDYWGDWLGWHYPYPVYYGYTAGSLLIEMLNLEADRQTGRKLPVLWDSFIGGLVTSSRAFDVRRTLEAVEQAFAQSPYLNKNRQ